MKSDYIVGKFSDANNGFKDQLRNIYGIQFFDLNNNNEAGNASVDDLNTIVNAKGTKLPFTLFSRGISGLPEFAMEEVVDEYFNGMVSILPGKMSDPSGTITLSVMITEELNPIRNLFKHFFKLYQTQTSLDDLILNAESDGGVSFNSPEEAAMGAKIMDNIEDDLSGNDSIYFKMVTNYVKYTNKSPLLSYVLYNGWFKSIKIHDSSNPENSAEIQRAEVQVRFDFGRVLSPSAG